MNERTERAVKMASTRNLPRDGLSSLSGGVDAGDGADVDTGSSSDLCGDACTFSWEGSCTCPSLYPLVSVLLGVVSVICLACS